MKIKVFCFFFSFAVSTCMASDLDPLLSLYNRPFTLLAIGKDVGHLVGEKAPSYKESTFVILEESPGNEEVLSLQENVIWMNHKLLLSELKDFASCEHVDILWLSNSLPMFSSNWQEALELFQQMAHRIALELPKGRSEELDTMHAYLSQASRKIYDEGSSVTYVLENAPFFRLGKTTLVHPRKRRRLYEIYCDENEKYLKKVSPTWSSTNEWLPGINMMTFLIYNGTIPSRSYILAHLPIDKQHSDWLANNMIIQGHSVVLIDKDDPLSAPVGAGDEERFRDLETKLSAFIATTLNLSPSQVRERFISIYNWGTYFDQIEIEE